MKKVFQTIIDPKIGNCMQAAVASLFDEDLEQVPNFISYGDKWWWELKKYLRKKGYKDGKTLFNEKINSDVIGELSFSQLSKHEGINGLFFAAVCSPKYNPSGDLSGVTHAVLIDKDFNIVHDPNPNNQDLKKYPLHECYNGIIYIEIYEHCTEPLIDVKYD